MWPKKSSDCLSLSPTAQFCTGVEDLVSLLEAQEMKMGQNGVLSAWRIRTQQLEKGHMDGCVGDS